MKIRLRLSIRILGSIILSTGLVFFITLKIIGKNFKTNASFETRQVNDNLAQKYAADIQSYLDKTFFQIHNYAQFVESCDFQKFQLNRPLYNQVLQQLLENEPTFEAVWDTWEINQINPQWTKQYGRLRFSFIKDPNQEITLKTDSLDLTGAPADSFYDKYKLLKKEGISDPYFSSYSRIRAKQNQIVSLVAPILNDENFVGLIGVDIPVIKIHQLLMKLTHDQDFDVSLFSSNGDILAHSNPKLLGENIAVADTFLSSRYNILERLQSAENSSFIIKDAQGRDSAYYTIASFKVGNTQSPWAVMIQAPLTVIESKVNNTLDFVKRIEWVGIIVLTIIVLIFALSIVFPLQRARKVLKKLALGEVHGVQRLNEKRYDEIGDISRSVNVVADGLEKVTQFAENIGKGNYEHPFTQLSENDILGNAVLEMRNSLRKAKHDEELREEEEKNLEWTSQGINIFNRVLRVDNQNLKELTYEIVKTISLYLNAHMGGIYLLTSNKDELELVSFIGFPREKYEKKYVNSGEGIVGRCMLEKESIFMNDVPKDFNHVISGLGHSLPRSILVVPLISNQELVGVLEIESLKEIFSYQMAFVERIAETIASTIAAVKTNVRTAELLDKAKKQAEELEQQEEEMRQNMEEMQATQEEAAKRESELMALIKGYDKLLPIIEYDLKGKVVDINENYLNIYKGRKAQYIGKQHKADSFMNEAEQQKHNEFWEQLGKGFVQESVEYIKSGKEEYWFRDKFVPVRDKYGVIKKIVCIGFDITELKKTESEIQQIHEGVITQKTPNIESTLQESAHAINMNLDLDFIDLTYLKMVYKKDPSKIYNILKLYFDTLPGQFIEINDLAKNRDFDKLKSKINSLKTKMSYMGLKKVYENLREIEKLLSENKNLTEIPGLLKIINNHWSLAYVELKTLLRLTE